MKLFVETIRITDGCAERLALHRARMERTMARFYPDAAVPDLQALAAPPQVAGVQKCRVVYGREVVSVDYTPYYITRARGLVLTYADDIDYRYKYADRSALDALKRGCAEGCEVLIVRNGLVTDTSYSNVAFHDGREWFTPRQPLLAGTRRRALIDAGILHEADITPADVPSFKTVSLINAMLDLGENTLPAAAVR